MFRTGVVRVSDVSVDGTDLIRARSTAGVTLCPGDSGGGTFTLARGGSGRVQVAVNSSTDLKHVSFMSSLASKPAQRFLLHWSQCRGTKICGVDVDAESCRLAKIPRHNVKRYLVDDPCPVAWQ